MGAVFKGGSQAVGRRANLAECVFSKPLYGNFFLLSTIAMVLKKSCADFGAWERVKSLIREALPSEFLKKEKTVYITNG